MEAKLFREWTMGRRGLTCGVKGVALRRFPSRAPPTTSHGLQAAAQYREQPRPPWEFARRVEPKRDAGGFLDHLVGEGTLFKSAPSFLPGTLPRHPSCANPANLACWEFLASHLAAVPGGAMQLPVLGSRPVKRKTRKPIRIKRGSALPALSSAGLLVLARLSFAALHQKSRVRDPIFSQNKSVTDPARDNQQLSRISKDSAMLIRGPSGCKA